VIADEPSTSSGADEFGYGRDQHTFLTRRVTSIWKKLRSTRSLSDVDMQFQTTEYEEDMTLDSVIAGGARYDTIQHNVD